MKTRRISVLLALLVLVSCGSAETEVPGSSVRPVTSPEDVLDALSRPIEEEFTSVSWSLDDLALGGGRMRAQGRITVSSQDANGNVSVEEESGVYVRGNEDGPWKLTEDAESTSGRYVRGDTFHRGPGLLGVGSDWSQSRWVPVEAVATHARFQPWTALGYEYSTAARRLVTYPRAARLPASYFTTDDATGPTLPYCMRTATGTPPKVSKVGDAGLWKVSCADDLGTYDYHVLFDEQGRLLWLFWAPHIKDTELLVPLTEWSATPASLPLGLGVALQYRSQKSVLRPDTSWFEKEGLPRLDQALRAACSVSDDPACTDGELEQLSDRALAVKFAEELTEWGMIEGAGNFDYARIYGRFTLAGLDISVPKWRFSEGGTVAKYAYDAYEVSVDGAKWCVRNSATRYELAAGVC